MKAFIYSIFILMVTSPLSAEQVQLDEVKSRFGNPSQWHVVLLGFQNPLQCKQIRDSGDFASLTVVDEEASIQLTQNEINSFSKQGLNFVSIEDYSPGLVDLVISGIPISKVNPGLRNLFIDKVIAISSRGYLLWDDADNDAFFEDLIASLMDVRIDGNVKPKSNQEPHTKVISWNHVLPKGRVRLNKTLTPSIKRQPGCAVTYDMSGGRLGDCLLAYLHAKWISYLYDIPLLYKDFPYSNQLMLSSIDQRYGTSYTFQNEVQLYNGKPYDSNFLDNKARSTLYVVPYFGESLIELEFFHFLRSYYFPVDWNDPNFRAEIIQAIQPKDWRAIPKLQLTDRTTVAVHVRTGKGFDSPNSNQHLPFKFPPHSYFIDQIRRITEIFKDQPLYIYLFTDDPNPKGIADTYISSLNNPNLQFIYRKSGNHHAMNVLQDMFGLAQCDCLIRGDSNFSIIPSLIKKFRVMIAPAHHVWEGDQLKIDQVNIFFAPKEA